MGSVTSETLASGSTFLVSTSFSCSIQARIPDSSPASGASSSSGTFSRARRAMRATASLSSDIPGSKRLNGAVGSRFALQEQPDEQRHRRLATMRPMTGTDRLYNRLTRRLRAMGSPARAAKEKSYQKSAWQHWGVALPQMDVAIRELLKDVPAA